MKAILLFFTALGCFGQIAISTNVIDYTLWVEERPEPILTIKNDLVSECKTNTNLTLSVAKLYFQLTTNVSVIQLNWGTSDNFGNFTPAPKTEQTIVMRERVAEVEGKKFVLSDELVSISERSFTEQYSTNRVYLK